METPDPHSIKYGGKKTLRWDTGRDLTGIPEAEVRIAEGPDSVIALTRNAPVEDNRIVALEITATDFGPGKLQPGEWKVEVRAGDLIHPDDIAKPFAKLVVLAALDGP